MIPRSQQLRSSPSGFGLCRLGGYLRGSSCRVHDGRGQGECGAGDTPVTWRRGGCKGKGVAMSQAEIYDFWGLIAYQVFMMFFFFGRIAMMHIFSMGKGLRSCSFGMCSSFGLHGMLEVASRHR